MNIDCVVVCVNYGDYLSHTLPLDRHLWNRQVIVTTPNDEETQSICRHYSVECLVTESVYGEGDDFNKGRAINEAMEHLEKTGSLKEWIIHKDVDIVMPPLTRHILESIHLNEQFLYGIDRVMCPTYEHWGRFMQNPVAQHEMAYIHVGPYPTGTRLMKFEEGGWVPLGFFQMFHRRSNFFKKPYYPVEWDSAATSDLYFAYRWPRTHRSLIPEIIAYHLATDDITHSAMGQNWQGRRTQRFEAKDPYQLTPAYRPAIKITSDDR
jgi:hypothetical protein